MDISSIIATNLTDWMSSTPGLDTIKKVEAKSGVGFGTIRRAKNGDANITVEKLAMIALAFKRNPSELLSYNNAMLVSEKNSEYELKKTNTSFADDQYQTKANSQIETLVKIAESLNHNGLERLIGAALVISSDDELKKT